MFREGEFSYKKISFFILFFGLIIPGLIVLIELILILTKDIRIDFLFVIAEFLFEDFFLTIALPLLAIISIIYVSEIYIVDGKNVKNINGIKVGKVLGKIISTIFFEWSEQKLKDKKQTKNKIINIICMVTFVGPVCLTLLGLFLGEINQFFLYLVYLHWLILIWFFLGIPIFFIIYFYNYHLKKTFSEKYQEIGIPINLRISIISIMIFVPFITF